MTYKMPLSGIRVADFAWVQAGPWIGRFFANYGAQVIRIESAKRLDWSRNVPGGPEVVDGKIQKGAYFVNFNCDKLGITLNLSNPQGVDIAKKLIAISDVVTNNFSAGYMDRIGLGYKDLVKVKPDIIMLEMPVFGNSGPRRTFAGYGTGIQSAIGLNSISGMPDRRPGLNIALPDMGPNPTHATIAVLAALHYRNKTGKGQYIELAQLESSLGWMETTILDYTVNGRVRKPQGNRLPYAAPHGVYRCAGKDGWCAICVFTDTEWKVFCHVIGDPALIANERFATLRKRKEYEDELDELVTGWTRGRSAWEVMVLLQYAGIAAGVVETGEDLVLKDEQYKTHQYYVELPYGGGKAYCENTMLRFSETPCKVRNAAPEMGQHNDYVYRELLGMSEEEIVQCYVDEVFA
ncbi:MAG: CoA transferase [Dehalococcoidia bacterium]|nr:CoA transferase [Dehalococcoidia bacterium]